VASPAIARAARVLTVVAVALLAAACATPAPARYAWGSYEDVIYTAQAQPGTLPPAAQIEQLEKDRLAARAAQQRLPPGWHAQLGYLYYQLGRADIAREELLAEKTEFPEAATFVDRLLANLAGGAAKSP
jgi:hypothetical protein